MEREYDIVIPIKYARTDSEPCYPKKGTKCTITVDFTENNIPLDMIAKTVVYEIKNKYYRKAIDEKENKE